MEAIERIIFHGHVLDVYNTIEDPLFLAVQVARLIDYSVGKTDRMLEVVDVDEKLTRTIFRSGQRRNVWFLTEDGLYEVLMLSRKPIAKRFKTFVKRVLRDLRRARNETPTQFFEYIDHVGELEAENLNREYLGLDPIPWEEWVHR